MTSVLICPDGKTVEAEAAHGALLAMLAYQTGFLFEMRGVDCRSQRGTACTLTRASAAPVVVRVHASRTCSADQGSAGQHFRASRSTRRAIWSAFSATEVLRHTHAHAGMNCLVAIMTESVSRHRRQHQK